MVIIRAMAPADLEAVMQLEASTPEAPHWNRTAYESYLAGDGSAKQAFVACDESGLMGFLATQAIAESCELESIVVRDTSRRTGVGRDLLKALVDWAGKRRASRVQLEVRFGNSLAIAFYERAGFQRDGVRRGYYDHPAEDALLMSLVPESALAGTAPVENFPQKMD